MKAKPILLALLLFLSMDIPAEAARDTLNVAMKISVTNLDLTVSTSRQTLVLCHNWADTLVYRDPKTKEMVPCLAESYRFVEPNVLEFTLRKGVRFHNGEPLDARAVKFSLELLKDPASVTSSSFQRFERAEIVDEHTIRIVSTIPNPTSIEQIANMLFIYPPDYYSSVGREGFGKHPVGTGPYRFVSWSSPEEIRFRANERYFGGPKGKARIPNLHIHVIPEQMMRIEALITGRVDLVRGGVVSPEQILILEQDENLKVRSAKKLRMYFIVLDALGRSGTEIFKDRRVRQAVNYAIDKDRICRSILAGYVTSTPSATTPLHFGHESDVPLYPYDPQRARTLLREAGYPDGFDMDFYAFGYETVAEAIVRDLQQVEIRAHMKWMGGKWDELYRRLKAGDVGMAFINWGSYSVFDASAILNPFFVLGNPLCYGSTSRLSEALETADHISDQMRRRALFSTAQKIIADEAYWVPLYYGKAVAAMHRDLDYAPSYDGISRFFTASWLR